MPLQALGHHFGNGTPGKGSDDVQWYIAVARVQASMTLSPYSACGSLSFKINLVPFVGYF